VLSPRAIYAIAGLLGVAAAVALAVCCAARTARTSQPALLRTEELLSNRTGPVPSPEDGPPHGGRQQLMPRPHPERSRRIPSAAEPMRRAERRLRARP
jgi:hypothetical protein